MYIVLAYCLYLLNLLQSEKKIIYIILYCKLQCRQKIVDVYTVSGETRIFSRRVSVSASGKVYNGFSKSIFKCIKQIACIKFGREGGCPDTQNAALGYVYGKNIYYLYIIRTYNDRTYLLQWYIEFHTIIFSIKFRQEPIYRIHVCKYNYYLMFQVY